MTNRAEIRTAMARENLARRTGRWGAWAQVDVHPSMMARRMGEEPSGWTRDITTAFTNGWCVVMVRPVATSLGLVMHATIRTARNDELTWSEKQRLKNDLFGEEATAVEVFPSSEDLVDGADIYHLWVLPPTFDLPFGLHLGRASR